MYIVADLAPIHVGVTASWRWSCHSSQACALLRIMTHYGVNMYRCMHSTHEPTRIYICAHHITLFIWSAGLIYKRLYNKYTCITYAHISTSNMIYTPAPRPTLCLAGPPRYTSRRARVDCRSRLKYRYIQRWICTYTHTHVHMHTHKSIYRID
jgi:hypothetical protein